MLSTGWAQFGTVMVLATLSGSSRSSFGSVGKGSHCSSAEFQQAFTDPVLVPVPEPGKRPGQERCRKKRPRIYLRPKFRSGEFSKFFEDWLCFESWETETTKFHQKSLACFNAKAPGKPKKKDHKSLRGERAN